MSQGASTMKKETSNNNSDPKKWPLGRYYWATVVYALKHHKRPPRLEFYFDGVRSLTLRIDEEQTSQFLLCQYLESGKFTDADTGEPLDLDALPEESWPQSQWEKSLGFNLIIEDDEDVSGNLFACEIVGNPDGISKAVDKACAIFQDQLDGLQKTRHDEHLPVLDAVITRYNEQDEMHESDRNIQ